MTPPRGSTTPRQWAAVIAAYAVYVVLVAAFPKLGRRRQWTANLGPRRLLAYIAARAALTFALGEALRHLRAASDRMELAKAELRERTGREPTERELLAHLGWT